MNNSLRLEAIKLLKDLVSIPSLSGSEYDVSIYIKDYLESIGFSPRIYEVYKGGYNVIVEIGDSNPSILIESHMDVVPAWDMEDAFNPVLDGDILVGRGACDTKGGLVSTLLTLKELVKHENSLTKKLIFAYVVDEEMYGRGAEDLLIRGIKGDYGIIIEPTNLTLSISIAGCIEFIIESYGISGHGAGILAGRNAIYPLMTLLSELRELDLFKESGPLENMRNVINLGKIKGGESAWMVPSYATAEVLIHFLPEYTFDTIWKLIKDFIKREEEKLDAKFNTRYIHGCEGYSLDPEDPFIKTLGALARKVFNKNNVFSHMPSESDANELYHKGGVKGIVFGPGDLNVAHSSIEYIKISDILKASEFLVSALM